MKIEGLLGFKFGFGSEIEFVSFYDEHSTVDSKTQNLWNHLIPYNL